MGAIPPNNLKQWAIVETETYNPGHAFWAKSICSRVRNRYRYWTLLNAFSASNETAAIGQFLLRENDVILSRRLTLSAKLLELI